MKRKMIIIQNYLSPYRVRLFAAIAQYESVDLTVALMAPNKPSYPMWQYNFRQLPFRTIFVPGTRLVFSNQQKSQVCLNPHLLWFLYKEKPNIIFCTGFAISSMIALLYGMLSRVPIVIWSEGTSMTENRRGFSFFRKPLRMLLALSADGFLVAGSLARDYVLSLLPKHGNKPIFISYNCVDSEGMFSACQRFKEDRKAWSRFRSGFPEKNILYSGRLITPKGIHQLLEVYKIVCQKASMNVGLILLGDGALKRLIQDYKSTNNLKYLFLEGFVKQDAYPKYFALADVFILLSLWDCNPLVIFEALSCGLPVVCSNRAGNAIDFIEEGKNGYIVDPYNTKKIAEKVLSILYNPGVEKMRNASREIVKKANYKDSAAAFLNITNRLTG